MKKLIYPLIVVLNAVPSLILAQNVPLVSKKQNTNANVAALYGKITDVKGKLLEGVTVYIVDLKLGTTTNSMGKYQFYNLPSGNYLVEVKSIGYKSVSQNIVLSNQSTHDFQLIESFTEVGDVVVTGVSKATLIKRDPVPIVTVSHDYLTTNLYTNAIDAIAKIPGVRAVTTGPNVSKPFIRGLGYNRILSLYDGVRQEGQQWGDEHGIEVDQYGVDKIEIIKGPASLSYGSDALAGVVNLIPKQPAPEGKTIGDVVLDYQTNNKFIGGSAMLGSTQNGFEWMGRISHKQATNYQNKYDGRVFGTAFNETDASASIGLHRKWGYSHMNFILFDDLQEIPDGSRDSASYRFTRQITEIDTARQIVSDADLKSYKIEKIHQHVQHYRVYWNNNIVVGNGNHLSVNFGYQHSIRREYSHPILFTIPGLYLQLTSFTYDLKYSFREFNNWNITTGINGMYQQNTSSNGTDFIIPNYHQFDIGPFITAKKSYGKLDIAAGARFDIRSFKNDAMYTTANPVTGFDMPVYGQDTVGATNVFANYSKTFSGFSGSLGFTYNFSEKFSMKANIGRGFRAPNISEISANGVHPGTNFYQIGNADFKPEFNLQEDIGFVYSSKYITAEASLFTNYINNYIYNQKLLSYTGADSVTSVNAPQTFKFQSSRANLYGGEISLDVHPIKVLHFENSLSIVYGDNKGIKGAKAVADSEKYLPFIPPVHGMSELRFDFNAKNAHFIKGFVKVQAEYYATQNRVYTAYNTETVTPGYTLFNAGFGGTFTNKLNKPVFSVYIMGNNLFDVAYQDHLSRLKYFTSYPNPTTGVNGIYNMGRNISLKINFPLSF
ncbi:TonB-dependent receptor [Parasediminibacterium paludis]|uniref:TonB-dependent receptor n=1 Tax=Parasediminibacterium paludis TaxID=908966 RepID=A0ABV8PYQ6_9BACT